MTNDVHLRCFCILEACGKNKEKGLRVKKGNPSPTIPEEIVPHKMKFSGTTLVLPWSTLFKIEMSTFCK